MATKRITALTEETSPATTEFVMTDGIATKKVTIANLATAARPFASQAEAEAGSGTTQTMNPLTTKQSIASEVGVTVQAYSANLSEYAAVNPTSAGLALLDDADAAAQRTTMGLGTAAVKDTGTSGDTVPKNNTANVFSEAQTVAPASGNATLELRKPASGTASVLTGTTNGSLRWQIVLGGGVAESGANAGSDLAVNRWSDAAGYLGQPFAINRSTGVVTMADGAVVGDASGDPVTIKGTVVSAFSAGLFDNADADAWRTELEVSEADLDARYLTGGSYLGTWNAATNTPTITSSTGTNGDFYVVSTAGTTTIDGISSWGAGDTVRFNGSVWQKIPNVNGVASVNGYTGTVVLSASDVGAQASDAELAAIAGLTSAADKVPYFTGSGTAALADLSSFGRTLIDDADSAAGRTTLGAAALAANTFTAAQSVAPVALTDGATITPNLTLGNYFTVTLGGNRALANPSSKTVGTSFLIVIVQDGTGSRTLSFGSQYLFPSGSDPTLSTAAGAIDVLSGYVYSSTQILCNFAKGFA